MPYLLLLRHSLPEIDPTISADQWHLSEEGQIRAHSITHQVATYLTEHIFSSPEPKALETGRILADQLGLSLESVASLHEHCRRNVSFKHQSQFESDISLFYNEPSCLVFGEETADQAYLRFSRAVTNLVKEFSHQTALIVSHGTVISLYLARTCNLEPFNFWKHLGLPSLVVLKLPHLKLESVINFGDFRQS